MGDLSPPAIDTDGTIYVATGDNKLYAVNPDGTKKWEINEGTTSSPLIGTDGTIYFGNIVLNKDGTKKYEYLGGIEVSAIGDDGTMYFKSMDGLYALSSDGKILWDFNFDRTFGTNHMNRPRIYGLSIGIDGSIYIGCHSGIFFDNPRFYAIFSDSRGLANLAWPKFGGNQFNSGVSHYISTKFFADSTSGELPLTVHFQDSSEGNIYSWLWDFGDSSTSTEQSPLHVYNKAGSFTVSLITTNPSRSDTVVKDDYIVVGDPTSIIDDPTPKEFCLYNNYPNPFNPSTVIKYSLPEQSHVKLKVFNILGGEVSTLVDKMQPQGNYLVGFDGSGFSSGIYFYRIKASNYVETKKMIPPTLICQLISVK